MPKDKKRSKRDLEDSDSDSGPDDRGPAKKATPTSAKRAAPPTEDGEPTWELGRNKKVKVREFKGNTYIDIREWYVDKQTMDTKPGKKGISLTCEQYQILKSFLPEIDRALP